MSKQQAPLIRRRDFVKGVTLAAAAEVTSMSEAHAQAGKSIADDLTADELRDLLKLEPNATCGFVGETYTSALKIAPGGLPAPFAAGRPADTALYFMMTPAAPVKLHRIKNDQLYHYYLGDPIELLMLHADGSHTFATVGPNLRAGQFVQLFIPGNTFHTAHIVGKRNWFLGASTEWPGVVPEDVELGDIEAIAAKYPDVAAQIRTFPVPVKS